MNSVFGAVLLYISLAVTLYATFAALRGAKKDNQALIDSARHAAVAAWPLVTLACLVLIVLLVRNDYNVRYVWSVTDNSMPVYLKVTALWGSQAGSLLFWSWLMSSFAALSMLRDWRAERALMPYVVAVSMGTLSFFLMLVTFFENPFVRYFADANGETAMALFNYSAPLWSVTQGLATLGHNAPGLLGVVIGGLSPLSAPPGATILTPDNGQGLNPLLRHIGMVIHPPMLYLGFVSFVVPFSFGFAALVRGEISDAWIRSTRRWTLVAWLFLSLGLIIGGRWAYDVLGWGGFWGWDPVENSALLPWLTGTAFLHSVMIQEKRGMMRRWNMVLITLTYLLVIIGTFLTRSGVLSSVHSFAQSAIGPLFFVFVAGMLVTSVYYLVKQWDALKSDNELENLLSRETMFLLNNFVFCAVTFIVFLGTFWPMATELAADFIPSVEKASVGPAWYNNTLWPLLVLLYLLMGIAPLVAWHTSSAKRLGKAILWPTVFAVVATVLIGVFTGFSNWLALGGFLVVLFSASVTVLEFHRGAIARVQAHAENYLEAIYTLMGRNRRRYGGYIIHLGVVILGLGVIATYGFQTETQKAVASGQTITLGDYTLEYRGLERFVATDGRFVTRVNTVVYKGGQQVATLAPRIDNYESGERMTIPATYSTLAGDDFYVLLVSWEQLDLSTATIKIYHNPMINWVWGGGIVFIFGTLIAAWPDFSEERREVTAAARRPVPAAGK